MMKNKKIIIAILLILLVCCIGALSACKNVSMQLTFVVDGQEYKTIDTAGNEMIAIPQSPTKTGYTFDGWFWDEGTWLQPFTANSLLNVPLKSDMFVYAKFTEIHTHSLTLHDVVAPKCDQLGNDLYYTCTCGKIFADINAQTELLAIPIIEKTAHTPGEWIIDKDPTCLTGGVQHKECLVCNDTIETETIPATGHTYSTAWQSDESGHWHVATCEHASEVTATEGHTYDGNYQCKICHYQDTSLHGTAIATEAFDVIGETLYTKVPYTQTTFSFITAIQVADDATFVVATDLAASNIIRTKTVSLEISDNTYYILVENGNDIQLYTATIRRRPIYTVTFNTNGGTSCSTQQIEEDNFATEPDTSKTGYTFASWDYNFEQAITANTTITASWTVNNYIITYDANGGELTEMEYTATYDAAYTLAVPTREGHTFLGWYIDDTQITNADGQSVKNWTYTENKTVIAKWSINSYYLNIANSAGGSISGSGTKVYNSEVTVTASKPYLGYNWIGWYNGDELVADELAYTFNMPANALNLSAKYIVKDEISNFNFKATTTECTITGIKDKTMTRIVVPDYVTGIDSGAFSGCNSLQNITLPFVGGAVKTSSDTYQYPFGYIFGTSSYTGGVATKQYYYRYSTSSTNYDTYYIPSSLKSVTITGGNILYGAFYNCSKLTNITIPDNVASIGGYVFYNCSNLTNVTIGDNVLSIGSAAFETCNRLTAVYYTGTIVDWCNISFGNNYANPLCYAHNLYINDKLVTEIEIPDGLTEIKNYAFYGCTSITNVTIPCSVTSLGEETFGGCTQLTKINYTGTIADWCDISFSDAYANPLYYAHNLYIDNKLVTELKIPYGVTAIKKCAFYGWNGVNVTIPASVTSIGSSVFGGCSSLENITLPFVGGSIKTSSDYYQYPFGYIFGTSSYTGGLETKQPYYNTPYNTTTTTYYIPSSLKSVTITGGNILYGAFYNCNELASIIIHDIKSIGASAFYSCSSLINIIIPDNVTSIDNYAFSNCSKLTSATIGERVTTIGERAFYNCNSLTNVIMGNNVTSIGSSVFYGCSNLKSIVIPDGVTSIPDSAFYNCSSLQNITIPDKVTSIGNSAFYNCNSLQYNEYDNALYLGNANNPYVVLMKAKDTTITACALSEKTKVICDSAFYNCSRLTNLTIPDSVTTIGNSALDGCRSLESITLPFVGGSFKTANSTYQYPFGYIFGTRSYTGGVATTQYYYGNSTSSTTSTTYYIPSTLKSVTITGGNILYGAFYNCSNLTSITIPNDITSIGGSVFRGCSSLTNITIPDSITSLSSGMLYGCSSLESITLPFVGASIKTSNDTYQYPFGYIFGTYSYEGGVATTQYYYGNSTSSTTSTTYYIPSTLKTVTINGGNILYGAFSYCSNLTNITIPNDITSIGGSAFRGCSGLTEITVSNNVTSIDRYAFYDCSSLTSITIPNSVKSIDTNAFYNCSNLTNLTIGNDVTSIGNSAFYNCNQLTAIYYTGTIADWCNINFGDLNANPLYYAHNMYIKNELVTELDIPYGVTKISNYAFYGCTSIISLTIPDSVTSLSSGMLSGCSSLQSITLPFVGGSATATTTSSSTLFGYIFGTNSYEGGVETKQYSASYYSHGYYIPSTLKSVTITGGNILYGAFSSCSNLTNITIPDSVTAIPDYAFYNCSNLTNIIIPNSVTSIVGSAFSGCSSLTDITIPNSVTSLSSGMLSGCSALQSITLPFVGGSIKTSNDTHQYPFGYIFGTNNYTGGVATKQQYYDNRTDFDTATTYYIPSTLKSVTITGGNILYGAFSNCSYLTNITIPDNIQTIGGSAFLNCRNLTNIMIPDDVTLVGGSAFAGCIGLTNIIIPDSVKSIGDYAFNGCYNLTSISIPNNVTSIGSSVFSGCRSLESITLPFVGESMKTASDTYQYPLGYIFGTNSYTGGVNTKQYYHGSSTSDATYTTYYIPSTLKSVTITDGDILYGAFYNCINLTSVTIGNSVMSINVQAFYNCRNLTNITISANNDVYHSTGNCIINTATKTLIYGCQTSVIPVDGSVTSIGNSAFYNCSGLTSITIPDSVTSIGNYAFNGCSNLTSITIPDSIMSVGEYVFYTCRNLTSITIPDSVTSIGSYAFSGCNNLTSVTIGNSVTSIGKYAFNNCSGLKTVYYKGTADNWAEISIGSSDGMLTNATRYYYSETEPALNADGTAYDGNYWYYSGNNEIIVWTYNKENN